MQAVQRAREVIEIEIAGLARARDGLDGGFSRAVDLMLDALRAGNKIVLTGIGKNLPIAEKISATLASTGSTSVVLNPAQAVHGDLGVLRAGDILLALSYSGESEEVLKLVPLAKRLGVRVVALTGVADSSLARHSEQVIVASVDREACPFNMAPTASTTAALAVGDALAMVLLDASGFGIEDYARLHPGGAIGRALLLKVADIMRTGERLCTVRTDQTVREAILAMTRARSGSCAVLAADGKLAGIFTDGDLRRNLTRDTAILDRPVDACMTRAPITVHPDQLASEVLRIFETHSIDDMLVVDTDGRLAGAVDIQDLPKFKIL